MSITRSSIAAVSITASIAGALILSSVPVQAAPGDQGNRGNRQGGGGFAVQCDFSHSASVDPIVMPGHAGMSADSFGCAHCARIPSAMASASSNWAGRAAPCMHVSAL